jgi:cytochrome P450
MMSERLASISLIAPETFRDPFPVYDIVRAEEPVFRSPELGMVVVTRYEDVAMVLRDTDAFSSRWLSRVHTYQLGSPAVTAILEEGYPDVDVLSMADGGDHAFHADLLRPFLNPGAVRALAPAFERIASGLVADLPSGEPFDIVSRFSVPMAIAAMCEFVGISADRGDLFNEAADAEVALLQGAGLNEADAVRNARLYVELQHVIATELADRLESPRDDLVTAIATAQPPNGAVEFSSAHRVAMVKVAVVAGNETTRGLISSCIQVLASRPELVPVIRADERAMERFIEEVLRAKPPVMSLFRVAAHDTVIGEVEVREGELLAVSYGSSNYDPAMFADPYSFDIDRANLRRHLSFGLGLHFCMGAPVARLESKIALRTLLNRFDVMQMDSDQATYPPAFVTHNLSSLHVRLRGLSTGTSRKGNEGP